MIKDVSPDFPKANKEQFKENTSINNSLNEIKQKNKNTNRRKSVKPSLLLHQTTLSGTRYAEMLQKLQINELKSKKEDTARKEVPIFP